MALEAAKGVPMVDTPKGGAAAALKRGLEVEQVSLVCFMTTQYRKTRLKWGSSLAEAENSGETSLVGVVIFRNLTGF